MCQCCGHCSVFSVICAGYRSSAKHNRHPGQDSVDSTFSMKMLVNCAHIWSVDLVHVEEHVGGRSLFKSQYKRMLCLSGQ